MEGAKDKGGVTGAQGEHGCLWVGVAVCGGMPPYPGWERAAVEPRG